jgi:membrane protease YdiL (CAAX protease family)
MPLLLVSGSILISVWVYFVIIAPLIVRKLQKEGLNSKPSIPLRKIYTRMSIPTLYLAVLALLTGFSNHIQIFGSIKYDSGILFPFLGILALVLFLEPLEWKCTSPGKQRKLLRIAPRTSRERLLCALFMWVPAIGEEILYRAVLFGLFYRLTGNYWTATIVTAVFFATAHRSYGLQAVISSFLIGLALQYFVYLSGGLYLSIAFHYIGNVINGMIAGSRQSKGEIAEDSGPKNKKMAVTG